MELNFNNNNNINIVHQNPINQNPQDQLQKLASENRYTQIPPSEISQIKKNYTLSLYLMKQHIIKKNLWRKEIPQEIFEFISLSIPPRLRLRLKQIELARYKLLYKVNGINPLTNDVSWFLILVDSDKKDKFIKEIDNDEIVLEDFGKILAQGTGEQVPEKTQNQIHQIFHMQLHIKALDLIDKAWDQTLEKNYEKSIQFYDKSLQYDQLNPTTYNNRGYCYIMVKQYENAKQDLKSCIKLDPKFANPYKHLSYVYLKQQKFVKALQNCQKALQLKPDYQEAEAIKKQIIYMAEQEKIRQKYKNPIQEVKYKRKYSFQSTGSQTSSDKSQEKANKNLCPQCNCWKQNKSQKQSKKNKRRSPQKLLHYNKSQKKIKTQ